jgi:hypothetical protein
MKQLTEEQIVSTCRHAHERVMTVVRSGGTQAEIEHAALNELRQMFALGEANQRLRK